VLLFHGVTLDLVQALILGIVEGLTEFLPVSSTGHLILSAHWMGLEGDSVDSFIDAIQSGAILAVIALYPGRFQDLLSFKKKGFSGWQALLCLGLTSLPPVIAALAFEKTIKARLFHPLPVALALAAGAILILLMDKKRQDKGAELKNLRAFQALKIGFWQCLALWPGMSRSACGILGGMNAGLRRSAAVEYSFLAAVPLLFAAAAYELMLHSERMSGHWAAFAVGFVVSFAAALAAVKFFAAFVSKHTLAPFAWYRLAAAVLIFVILH